MKLIDLTGKKFGRLTVTGKAENDKYGHTRWNCICDCGNQTTVYGSNIRPTSNKRAPTSSCGCLAAERASETQTTHGMSKHPSFSSWSNMMFRCYHKQSTYYEYYGGRGIKVCQRWKDVRNFIADMGEKPKGMTLDRINTNGNYEPQNCKWSTRKEQSNNRRSVRRITYNGITLTLTEWSLFLGGSRTLVSQRLRNGWSETKAVTTPPRKIAR